MSDDHKPVKATKNNIDEVVAGMKEVAEDVSLNDSVEFMSSGSTLYDLVCGGGNPVGKIINIVGSESSGKTLMAMEFIANCRQAIGKKLKWVYDDAEAGFSFDTKRVYGFSVLKEDQAFSETVEEFAYNLHKQLDKMKKNEYLIYVLDSLDALTSSEEIGRDKKREEAIEKGEAEKKGTFNLEKQKKLGGFFRLRKREIIDKKCILIIISQVRINVGVMFGPQYYRTGGKALDMYASLILWLAIAEKHEKKERVIGVTTKVRCTKNKVGIPFRECFLDILFDYGVDDLSSNIKWLYNLLTPLGKLKSKKDKIEWEGKEYSLPQFITFCEENNLEGKIKALTIAKWRSIEEEISAKDRKPRW